MQNIEQIPKQVHWADWDWETCVLYALPWEIDLGRMVLLHKSNDAVKDLIQELSVIPKRL